MKPKAPFLEVVSEFAGADPELDGVLAAARSVAEPALENRDRVAVRLRLALDPSFASSIVERESHESAAPGSGAHPSAPASAHVRASSPDRSAAPHAARQSPYRLLFGGAVIGALGFWLGHDLGRAAGFRDALLARTSIGLAQPASADPANMPPVNLEPADVEPSRLSSPASARPPESPAHPARSLEPTAPLPEAHARMLPATSTQVPSAPASSRSGRGQRAASPARPARDHDAMSFRQVLEQLRRARRSLEGGQATLALLLLDELDRGAGELLREEREATRVLALCAAGEVAAARRAAEQLSDASPRSIYAMRLGESCVASEQD
jgi:hypothetical protein